MFRKVTLAIAAIATIGAAALAPTAASAGYKGKYWGGYGGYGHSYSYGYSYYTPRYVAYDYSCWKKYWVDTPYGPVLKKVYVCSYY